MKIKFSLLLSVFACVSLLTSCGQATTEWYPINNNIIKIAIIGDDEYIKDNGSMEAMEMAADTFGEETGIAIETVIYDDDADYNQGVSLAKEIADDNSISVVIVKQELDYIDTVAEIFEKAKKPFIIASGCYEHTITKAYDYMLVDCINAKAAGSIMAEWVSAKGYQKVAFCHSDTEYEEDELKGFQAQINGSDVDLIDTVVGPYTQEEFDLAYERWLTLGIDAVCISNYDMYNSELVRMLREKGSDIPVVGDYVMDTDTDIKNNGKYLDGTAIVAMYINDYNDNDTDIMDAYYEKYGMTMSEKAIQSYDIIYMIGEGLQSGITSSEEFIDYMKQHKGYNGISGTISFDENGCLIPNGNEMLVFQNGMFTNVDSGE